MSFFGGRRPSKPVTSEGEPKAVPPPPPRQPVGFETVLGANSTLLGELRSQANVRLDGTFEGNLEIEGNVLVGETAKITADIHAKNVSVAGAVRGNISGNKVQLLRTARVWGNISAAAITTEEGAFIDGKLTMIRHDASTESIEMNALPAPKLDPLPDSDEGAQEEELELVEGEPVETPEKKP